MGILATLAVATALTAAPATAPAATGPSAADLQAGLTAARIASGAPGATAAVVRDGRVLWAGASGSAVTRTGVDARTGRRTARRSLPMRTGTRFSLASLSKMYTATLVLRLVEQGRVGLDDPIARWVPSTVPGRTRVTVRMLLGHTSGYPDIEDAEPLASRLDIADPSWNPDRPWTRDELMRLIRAPKWTPGARYEYSNTNYILLGAVLEGAGAGTVPAQLAQVTAPLGLRDTFYATQPGLAATMARGYERFDGERNDHWAGARDIPTDLVGPVWTDGGVITTAADAARFCAALMGGRILGAGTLATMIDPGGPGRAEDYGLGTFHQRIAGRTWQGHDGEYGGYESMAFTDRAHDLTLAVLVNADGEGGDGSVYRIFTTLARALRGA